MVDKRERGGGGAGGREGGKERDQFSIHIRSQARACMCMYIKHYPLVFYLERHASTHVSSFYPVLLLHPLRHAHRIALRAGLNLVTVRRNLVFKNKYGRYTKLSNRATDLQRPAALYNRDTLFLPALGEQFPGCLKAILMDEQNSIIRRIYEGMLTHQFVRSTIARTKREHFPLTWRLYTMD